MDCSWFLFSFFGLTVNVLVNVLQKGTVPIDCVAPVVVVDGIVSIKHFPRRMSGNLHDNRFRHPGFSHVRVEGMAKGMEDKAALAKPSVINFRIPQALMSPVLMDLAGLPSYKKTWLSCKARGILFKTSSNSLQMGMVRGSLSLVSAASS